MVVLELSFAKLKWPFASTHELEQNPDIAEALKISRRQKGCLGCKIGLLEEDHSKAFALLEWERIEDHTVDYVNSADFKLVGEAMYKVIEEFTYMAHYEVPKAPHALVNSETPVLEIYVSTLKKEATFVDYEKAFEPMVAHFASQGRMTVATPTLDKNSDKEKDVLFLLPWKSIEEHNRAAKEKYVIESLFEHNKLVEKVQIFGHVIF